MKKEILYQYLGTNGTILSPVHLEDVYYVRKWKLTADDGKNLYKKDEKVGYTCIVPEDELDLYSEK